MQAIRHKGEFGGIATIADLDTAIKIIGLCDLRLEQIDHEMQLQINRIKSEALAKAAEAQAERDRLLRLCETFVRANTGILEGKKAAAFNFGKVGFRKAKDQIQIPRKGSDEMDALVRRIEELIPEGAPWSEVKIHVQRYVLMADVKGLTDEQLAQIDLKRIPGSDVFFVEPDRTRLEEVASE